MYFQRLINIRELYNYNQNQMAKILKTSQSNYSRWEKATELIPLDKLSLFCNYFNTNMDYMLGISNFKNGNGTHLLNKKIIGKRIKIIRKKYIITQKELAACLNTTQSTISANENGKTKLLTAFAIQIVYKYNISLDWICGRTDNMNIKKQI
ncbi:MAG: helix-turn-helix domain-containing protein [Bacilli bacterium]|nr:helix-turn-helix domain-containing protein [Bacilli bacterium]